MISKPPRTEKDMIRRFFKLVQSRKFSNFDNIFEHDAVVREPFSQAAHLQGRGEIQPFLEIVLSPPTNVTQPRVKIGRIGETLDHRMAALVSFDTRTSKPQCRLVFDLNPESKKIRKLEVEIIR